MKKRSSATAFFVVSLISFVFCLMIVVIINAIVDPYASMPSSISPIARDYPVRALISHQLTKTVDIMRLHPKAILLGSSRMEWGLNSCDVSILPDTNCYNIGLAGANFYEMNAYFEHALHHQPDLKLVIIGLDLYAFNLHRQPRPDFSENRLACTSLPIADYIKVLLTFDALRDSCQVMKHVYRWLTIGKVYNHLILDQHGNVKEESIRAYLARCGTSFEDRQRIILASLFNTPDIYEHFELSEDLLDLFRKMVARCREHGITLKVFFNPVHAVYWYALKANGLGEVLRQFKAQIAREIDVWDFSGANKVTSEPFEVSMENHHFDGSHFNPEVGLQVIRTLFGVERPAFGRLLTSENYEKELDAWEQELTDWVDLNPQTVDFVHKYLLSSRRS